MLHGSHQVHTGHKQGIAHKKRLRRSWVVLAVILLPALILFISGSVTGTSWSALGVALATSFVHLFTGYSISLVIGVTAALLIGWSRYTNTFLPVLDVLQNVPSFALIPIFHMIFGYSDLMIVIFVATTVIWPILFYTLSAVHGAREDLNDAATVFGATGIRRLQHYLMPLSLPAIVTGSIVGMSIGWESVIGVEIIGNIGGIGTFLTRADGSVPTATLTVGIIAILCLVFIINRLLWTPLLAGLSHYGNA
jgi:ABC-type nitrate/sulfonate/bicarbonate transport system permease component